MRAPGLELDAGGHLVAGLELRKLMDSYLARGAVAGRTARAQQLQAYLKRELVAPAAAEGERFAAQYLQYLEVEERAIVREGFSDPAQQLSERDVQRLLAYRDQRAQRRERMFGAAVARAWFDADDSRCVAALREWQVQHVAPEPGQELDPVEIRQRRIHGAVLETRRDEAAQACAVQMSRADGGG
jgi:lipase chaperone LimK